MKIYTGRGDGGRTSLFSGERVGKDARRVEAYGTLDELNSLLGWAQAETRCPEISEILTALQSELFEAGADLATVGSRRRVRRLGEDDWRRLESLIDQLDGKLPPLRNFVLPGGSAAASVIHMARSVCRRGERLLVRLMRAEPDVNEHLLVYLNRLSDLLFVLARYENFRAGAEETPWRPRN
jgi:cob(I)alamin adenosyltransferase